MLCSVGAGRKDCLEEAIINMPLLILGGIFFLCVFVCGGLKLEGKLDLEEKGHIENEEMEIAIVDSYLQDIWLKGDEREEGCS